MEHAFILRTEVQAVKGDADVSVGIRVWRRSGRGSLSLDGRWIANERVKEQAHVVCETHRVGLRDPVNEDLDAKNLRILGSRSLLPYVLEAAHYRIERRQPRRTGIGHDSGWILAGRIGREPSFGRWIRRRSSAK
jgi:hypothetical protein